MTGEYGELQRQQIEAEAELTEKYENFFNIGQSGFQELTGKVKLFCSFKRFTICTIYSALRLKWRAFEVLNASLSVPFTAEKSRKKQKPEAL